MPAIPRLFRRPNPASLLLYLLLILLGAAPARAHNPMTSWTVAHLAPGQVELEVELSLEAAMALLGTPMGTAPAPADPSVLLMPLQQEARAGGVYRLSAAGQPLEPDLAGVELREEDGVAFRLLYAPPVGQPLRFDAVFLALLKPDHRSALTLLGENNIVLESTVLRINASVFDYSAPETIAANDTSPAAAPEPALPNVDHSTPVAGKPEPAAAPRSAAQPSLFRTFLKLGFEHILLGYDHLLFLGGLLLACRRLKTMIAIITCFTIAHSITLALAALDVATLPGRIVEPLIAASIVFVGVENLLRRNEEPKGRWMLTFLFGLVHGFGFASVLREIGFGSAGEIVVPLLAFNLGVELGQLAVAVVAVALLWPLRERQAFARYARPALSVLVAAAGATWLTQRLLQA